MDGTSGQGSAVVARPSPGSDPNLEPAPAVRSADGDLAAAGTDEEGGVPRSPRREATRQRILDAAREVFAERGVIGGTVEDICDRAGFTRGAFYSNFGDKDDVVDALVQREHERLLGHVESIFAEVDRAVAEAGDLPSVLGILVEQVLRSIPFDRQLSLVQTELEIFAIRRPDQAGRFLEISHAFRDRIAEFLDRAMRRHGRRLLVDPALLTDAIVAIAESSVRRALLAGPDADPDELSNAILPGLLLALSRPEGESPSP
jgi:AcrR family transcriptional regulator